MASRFEKFSERARRVLSLAQEEATKFNHDYIGTEHILLGLIRESEGVAAKVLNNLKVDMEKIKSDAKENKCSIFHQFCDDEFKNTNSE